MRKLTLFTFLCFITSVLNAQNTDLKTLLTERAGQCYSNLKSNIAVDVKIVDDIANGYLYVENAIAGCGCICKSTNGAYKMSTGDYLVLGNTYFQCSFNNGVSANLPFETFMPDGFGLPSFYDTTSDKIHDYYPALILCECYNS